MSHTNETKGDTLEQLSAKLEAYQANFLARADQQKIDDYEEGIRDVLTSGIIENALQVGDSVPNFKLTNAKGDTVDLSTYLKKGPVVLTWYRGGWCPYCNLTLRALQNALPKIKASGANLLALTPETPDNSMSTKDKHALEFEVLSDLHNEVAKKYGIVFELTPVVAQYYNKAFDLEKYNNDQSNELPLAATYVISPAGKVIWAFLDADYRKRAEPADIINALKAFNQKNNTTHEKSSLTDPSLDRSLHPRSDALL